MIPQAPLWPWRRGELGDDGTAQMWISACTRLKEIKVESGTSDSLEGCQNCIQESLSLHDTAPLLADAVALRTLLLRGGRRSFKGCSSPIIGPGVPLGPPST